VAPAARQHHHRRVRGGAPSRNRQFDWCRTCTIHQPTTSLRGAARPGELGPNPAPEFLATTLVLTRARSTSELSTAGGPTPTDACAQNFVSVRFSAELTVTVGRVVHSLCSAVPSARCGCSASAARGVGMRPLCGANASSVVGSSPKFGGGVSRMATDDRSWPIERRPSAYRLAVRGRQSEVETAKRR
jgi:hypothetical protein